ncbi:type I phosphomannose isomerase catalytic subunit [Butyrivibrio sp. XPD2006]|uniref:type I phosphomannose isomerase catalytic subunit n=1 Tax=Butyrivibrio sp. XPD2006 TaxID=1280668 RepID=UPI0003B58A9A|nr:type I phosphomannose isomerase catalytic subunit [Butyrivibrio sp. XPD2006]
MGNKPFMLLPAAKDYIWGGSRLNDDFNKNIDMSPLAETWECSAHPDGQSIDSVSKRPLGDILKEHPEYLGTHPLGITGGVPTLPILIKLIDAKSDLSVQVHPDDEYARIHENSFGKTEMWYVLDAHEDSKLVYGFNRDVTENQVRQALNDGTIRQLLNYVQIHKNDLFFIDPGTVHAIGAGALIAEIQENSNITYRLYDYDRIDKNGNKRQLHIDKAMEVSDLKSKAIPRQPMRSLRYNNGCAKELLASCKYFRVDRMLLNTEGRKMPDFRAESNSFHALLVTDGCGVIFGEGLSLNFFKGDCIFVPADSMELKLHGKAQILDVSC